MKSKRWKQRMAVVLSAALLAVACPANPMAALAEAPAKGTVKASGTAGSEAMPAVGITFADPCRTDTFVMAQDFETYSAGEVLTDFTVKAGVGVDGSQGAEITHFQTSAGTHRYTMTIPQDKQAAPGEGAEYLWFYINTNAVPLRKGWITLCDEDGVSFTPDTNAPDDGEFYQQNEDGVWETQHYQPEDNGCFVDWVGAGYVRIKLSDFGIRDLTKKIVSVSFDIKDRVKNYKEEPIVYPETTTVVVDNFGFSGSALAGNRTVGDLLHEASSQFERKIMIENFEELAEASTVPSSACAGYPRPNEGTGTYVSPISANGYNGTKALSLYSPAAAGTGGQFTVFADGDYFHFANTDFSGRQLMFFETWVDFSQVVFRKLAFKVRCGGLYGDEYFTDNKDGDNSMVYYIEENGQWVEKPFGGTDGCIEAFGNYKGFIRIPMEYFVNKSGIPLSQSHSLRSVDCFGFWFALQDAGMVEKPIVFDEIGLIAGPVRYTNEKYYFSNARRLSGSFIQSWMIQNWNQSRWDTEILNMKKSGMDFIILQSLGDTDYGNGITQNPDKTELKSCSILYPSKMPEFDGGSHYDALEKCLKACKKYNMKAMLGSISDNRLWRFGVTKTPLCPLGKSDAVRDSYMTKWLNQYDGLCERMIKEVMELYGKEYKNQIYGWYYNLEFSNYASACRGTDDMAYAHIMGNSLSHFADSCTRYCPGKPMMLSPFVHPSHSTPAECGKMWTDVFSFTTFRDGDIFCPQDSFGGNNQLKLEDWYREYKKAVDTKHGLKLWANNESFRGSKTLVAAAMDSYIGQIKATEPYTSGTVGFSWNHYYSPEKANSGYDRAYQYYIKNGVMDTECPSAPVVTVNGTTAHVVSADNVGIYCVKIYKSNGKTVAHTNVCSDNNDLEALQTVRDLKAGSYYAQTVDFYSNVSEMVPFTVNAK